MPRREPGDRHVRATQDSGPSELGDAENPGGWWEFAYREFGPQTGVPLVVLTHLGANLDSWDPRIVDGLAEDRHVIAAGYRGVGKSTGQIRDSIEDMAEDMAQLAAVRRWGMQQSAVAFADGTTRSVSP